MAQKSSSKPSTQFNRRNFIIKSSASLLAATCPSLAFSSTAKHANIDISDKYLSFLHLHTNESLQCCYWKDSQYDVTALAKINHLLRDHRTSEIAPIDTNLLDTLYQLRSLTHSRAPFEIISGFRSAKTNEQLRKNTSGVAKRSYHMQGKAIDIRLADVDLKKLRDTAISLQAGGVGYYRKSGFLHIDMGRPRNW